MQCCAFVIANTSKRDECDPNEPDEYSGDSTSRWHVAGEDGCGNNGGDGDRAIDHSGDGRRDGLFCQWVQIERNCHCNKPKHCNAWHIFAVDSLASSGEAGECQSAKSESGNRNYSCRNVVDGNSDEKKGCSPGDCHCRCHAPFGWPKLLGGISAKVRRCHPFSLTARPSE